MEEAKVLTAAQIGERIKERRTELGLSMERLGKMLGVNKSTIQRYEAKGIDPGRNYILVSMAEALETTVEWLTGESEQKELDIEIRLKTNIDEHVAKFIQTVNTSIDNELHQELVTNLMNTFIDMFGVYSVYFGDTMREIEKVENDSGLKKSIMKYALQAADISEKVYRQRMKEPVDEMMQMLDCLYRMYDNHSSALPDFFTIRDKAQKKIKNKE